MAATLRPEVSVMLRVWLKKKKKKKKKRKITNRGEHTKPLIIIGNDTQDEKTLQRNIT